MRPADIKATEIRFGIELETAIPTTSGITIGAYHGGRPVTGGLRAGESTILAAPAFNGAKWNAERDGSIRYQPGEMACEFVSPILHGEAGVAGMCDFVGWLNGIGARVNDSCGCHVTVSVDSVVGASDAQARADFARKLAHIAQWHARAIYGQTGTGRHLNHFSHTFAADVAKLVKRMQADGDLRKKEAAAVACGRGMVNFRKVFYSFQRVRYCASPVRVMQVKKSAFCSGRHKKEIRCHAFVMRFPDGAAVCGGRAESGKYCWGRTVFVSPL